MVRVSRTASLLLLGCWALLCARPAASKPGPGAQGVHGVHRHGAQLHERRVPREVDDNEAEATDADPGADAQYQQQYADPQEAQEARHFSRQAEDNFEDEQDIVYDFSYEVKDPHTGNDFGHRQSRSGGLTQGQYRVLLPDGRMQVVDYVSDRDGFRPNIRYEDVGIPVFAGTEQHEQFADGTNHFEQEQGLQGVQADAAPGDTQGPSPDDLRRRRRREAAVVPGAAAAAGGRRRHHHH